MSNINKKVLGAGAALVALSSFVPNPFMMSGQALAQATATATLSISASVVNPLNVKQLAKLNFGVFAVTANNGSVTFKTAGETFNNGFKITSGTLGKITFTAPQNATFTISIPDYVATAIKISAGGGGSAAKTMKVDAIYIDATAKIVHGGGADALKTYNNADNDQTAKITDAGGVGKATVGGHMNFKPTNIVGVYTGTYTILMTF